MRSIRLSLIVYFLLLLIAAESVAFWLVYRSAQDALREKQEINRALLETQYQKSKEDEERRAVQELFDQAKEISALANRQSLSVKRNITRLLLLGQMGDDAQAPLTSLLWNVSTAPLGPRMPPHPIRAEVQKLFMNEVTIPEESLPRATSGETEYFQINPGWWPHAWRSQSLGDDSLPYTGQEFSANDYVEWKEDAPTLGSKSLRRVMLKVPISSRNLYVNPPMGSRGRGNPGQRPDGRGGFGRGPGSGPREPPPEPPGSNPSQWAMVIHVAREPKAMMEAFTRLENKRELDLQEHDELARGALASLRQKLLSIGAGTVVATMLGGLLLVGYGLAPLRRLSDAVSRVSPSDFKLPLESHELLPRELIPIRERLEGTLGQLGKAFEREKQASADISHELRTPVASLLTTVEVALKKPRSAEEYRKTLEECRAMGRQMRQLVERIMAIARLDAGSDRIKPRAVDVAEVVAESAALVRPLAAERGLELRVHCPNPVTLTTDPDKLREVLVNLLHNAVQYNKPHGAVDVAANRDNGWVDLTVQDTGIGIQPEARDHIFERFYRVDASRHADDLHAGLGLSIVKGYVGLLGGTISVESEPGQGSTFRVRLPTV